MSFHCFCPQKTRFFFSVLDESLRWLVANHRFKDVRHVIRKAARYNHHNPEAALSTALTNSDALRMTGKDGHPRVESVLLSSIAEVAEEEAERPEDQFGEEQGREVEDEQRDGRGDKQRLEEERGGEEGEVGVTRKRRQEGFLDLIKDPDMRFLTFIMLYIW